MNAPTVTVAMAAIKINDCIYTVDRPGRHHHIIHRLATELNFPTPIKGEQGFVLSNGLFVGRKEAREIALLAGQCTTTTHQYLLFSEDLW